MFRSADDEPSHRLLATAATCEAQQAAAARRGLYGRGPRPGGCRRGPPARPGGCSQTPARPRFRHRLQTRGPAKASTQTGSVMRPAQRQCASAGAGLRRRALSTSASIRVKDLHRRRQDTPGTQTTRLDGPFELDYGGTLPHVDVAWEQVRTLRSHPALGLADLSGGGRQWGDPSLPAERTVYILPSFSNSSHVVRNLGDPSPGWWEGMVGPGLCVPPPPRPVAYCRSQASCCWTRQVRRHEPIPRAQREQPGRSVRHNLAGERGAGHWASVSPPLPANHTRRRGSGPPSPDAAGICQQACDARYVAIAASHVHS